MVETMGGPEAEVMLHCASHHTPALHTAYAADTIDLRPTRPLKCGGPT